MKNTNRRYYTPPQAGPGSGAFNRNDSGSAGIPSGFSLPATLKQDMEKASISCFGGRVFTSRNQHSDALICHAIRITSVDQITKLSAWYHMTRHFRISSFLPYAGSVYVDDYCVFTFDLYKNQTSLRKLMEEPESIRMKRCKQLFADLTDVILDYQKERGASYSPLCFLSLDTVFLDDLDRVSVLPLMCDNISFPRGYPLEAGTAEADETTDLYTAALLTLQVLSGCEYETADRKMRLDLVPDCLRRCLNLFPSGRPPIREVYAAMNLPNGYEKSKKKWAWARTASGNIILEKPLRGKKPDPAPTENRWQAPVANDSREQAPNYAENARNSFINDILEGVRSFREPLSWTSGTAGTPSLKDSFFQSMENVRKIMKDLTRPIDDDDDDFIEEEENVSADAPRNDPADAAAETEQESADSVSPEEDSTAVPPEEDDDELGTVLPEDDD